MKKFLVILAAIIASGIIFSAAQAALLNPQKTTDFNNNLGRMASSTGVSQSSLEDIIGNIIRLALSLLGVIFLALGFWAGNNWMQAGGNEEKVKKAQATIRNLLIGLILVVIAYALSSVLGAFLTSLVIKSQ